MAVTVIVGAQWGDEGKGKVTDFLAEEARIVARYQGGNNAGHTVIANGQEFKFHLLPSGVVHPEKLNVIGNGVVIDPEVLLGEVAQLTSRGLSPRLAVSDRAHVIMPYHRLLDGLAEARAKPDKAIGTTKRGIGPCYADKMARVGIRIGDLLDPQRLRERVEAAVPEKQAVLDFHQAGVKLNAEEITREYAAFGQKLQAYVRDTTALLLGALDEGQDVLLEGAQGTFLDIDHGTFPFVTSSNTTAGGACTGTGIPPTAIQEVIGIVKAYTTRVGGGPFVTELPYETDAVGKHLTDVGHEFGTTTGRRRRTGWLDLVMLRRSAQLNGFTGVALTKLDVLAGLPELKVAVAYESRGKRYDTPPSDPISLAHAKPVYETLPGFGPLTQDTVARAAKAGLEALPDAAARYVTFVEEELDVPVLFVGLGPSREATIDRREDTW